MAEQKYLVIVDAKDIELLKAAIEELNEKVDQLLNDRLENADTYLTSEEAAKCVSDIVGLPVEPSVEAIDQVLSDYLAEHEDNDTWYSFHEFIEDREG